MKGTMRIVNSFRLVRGIGHLLPPDLFLDPIPRVVEY